MIERNILKDLKLWQHDTDRKPLVLKGARQVGKSFIIEKFGQKEFKQFHCINFQSNRAAHTIFSEKSSLNPRDILKDLGHLLGQDICPQTDLLFFDEIQECPGAINACKFFHEELPELALITAGSYLGLMQNEESFPVGKVTFLSMFPLTFAEFLRAVYPSLFQEFSTIDLKQMRPVKPIYHNDFLSALRLYFVIGGMPEVVQKYIKYSSEFGEIEALLKIRKIQHDLVEGYISDFAKHGGTVNATHILHLFKAVPAQLSKAYDEEVRKFKFTGVIPKQKGFEKIRGPLGWLTQSRLVIKSKIAKEAVHPILSYVEDNRFKLYFFDIGLLNALLGIPPSVLMQDQLGSYKGFIAENFIAQELFAKSDDDLISWQKATAEIEFLIQRESMIIPLEVKSSQRSTRAKSLFAFIDRYLPEVAYKLSGQNYGLKPEGNLIMLPLYLVGKI